MTPTMVNKQKQTRAWGWELIQGSTWHWDKIKHTTEGLQTSDSWWLEIWAKVSSNASSRHKDGHKHTHTTERTHTHTHTHRTAQWMIKLNQNETKVSLPRLDRYMPQHKSLLHLTFTCCDNEWSPRKKYFIRVATIKFNTPNTNVKSEPTKIIAVAG